MIVIGITGTLGAGKGTIVEYLVTEKNFNHFSVREYLTKEILARGMEVNRDSMVVVANELRAMHSPAYIVEQLYEQALISGQNCIIESIRTPGEALMLKQKAKFFLFAVDALPQIRYRRIKQRASATDFISYETFLENENREMTSDDPAKQNLKKCIEMSDFYIENNEDREHLYHKIAIILNKIGQND
ncbi:MAG TPA: AAA family ATPase [Bacteroidales bacterium]|nr:AAA family ATPase [Bacteroidales bacterium]